MVGIRKGANNTLNRLSMYPQFIIITCSLNVTGKADSLCHGSESFPCHVPQFCTTKLGLNKTVNVVLLNNESVNDTFDCILRAVKELRWH